MPAELLVTGCYRSGTTLLEKLLHSQPDAGVASQPFPALYSFVKELFDAERGLERRYPLGHRFLEDRYADRDFAEFLDRRSLGVSELDRVFELLAADQRGLWTPGILGTRAAIRPGVFLDVYRQLLNAANGLLARSAARIIGSKEILVEEYVPYLLANGIYVVIIVRDPRDMIASLDFSERDNATGMDRPVLYSVRVWRKSVATALAFDGHPRFHFLRYEDLVADPQAAMSRLRARLGLPEIRWEAGQSQLRDQNDQEWLGNSSFRDQAGISCRSVGRFKDKLPSAVRSMIEASAGPEMALLGYARPEHPESAIVDYRDPFPAIHQKFPAGYSADPRRVRDELVRLRMLSSPSELSDEEARRWFVYPQAYRRLKAVASGAAGP